MEDKKPRQMNERSLENLKLGALARSQGKARYNFSLLPETVVWLKGTGNASDAIDALVDTAKKGGLSSINTYNGKDEQAKLEALREENARLLEQLAETKEKLETAQAEANSCLDSATQWQTITEQAHEQIDRLKSPAANLEATRDRFLAGIKLGKQAPEYKRTKAVIDRFLAELRK